jgi:hypothetical protein
MALSASVVLPSEMAVKSELAIEIAQLYAEHGSQLVSVAEGFFVAAFAEVVSKALGLQFELDLGVWFTSPECL